MTESQQTDMERAKQDLERLAYEMAAPPFHDLLQPQAVSVDPSDRSVVVRLPFRPELCGSRQQSFFHGGVIASLIDLTGHAAIAIQVGYRRSTCLWARRSVGRMSKPKARMVVWWRWAGVSSAF
jgi:acyl-coenzyme A thioesterase PaaI-like protein